MTVLSSGTMHDKDKCIFHILAEERQGPVSSKHLRRIYVFKCLRTCLRQNSCFIKLWRLRKFSLFVLYVGQKNRCPSRYFCPKLYIHVLTMAAAFQVILEADEDDIRPRLKQHSVFRDGYICFTIMLFTDLHLYC